MKRNTAVGTGAIGEDSLNFAGTRVNSRCGRVPRQ